MRKPPTDSAIRVYCPVMTTPTTVTTLGVAVLTCLLLGACGSSIDSAELEKGITSLIDKDMKGDVRVKAVDCPEDPDADEDTTFTCDFTMHDDSDGEVTVTVRGDEEDFGYTVTQPASGQVEDEIRADYEEQDPDVKVRAVDCPDAITVGGETTCTLKLGNGATGDVKVTTENDGTYVWETV
jgi:Domain of unknown function (DUF4333)